MFTDVRYDIFSRLNGNYDIVDSSPINNKKNLCQVTSGGKAIFPTYITAHIRVLKFVCKKQITCGDLLRAGTRPGIVLNQFKWIFRYGPGAPK